MEHLKANVLIVIGGALGTWLLIFVWKLALLPHDIYKESGAVVPPSTGITCPTPSFWSEKGQPPFNTRTTRVSHPQQRIVEMEPAFGNLADRANTLSEEIMADLYRHGWPQSGQVQTREIQQKPNTPDEARQWTKNRSAYFRYRFLNPVLEIRNEFAQFHLRDEKLDQFFKLEGKLEQAKELAAAANGHETEFPILPTQIEEIAERLKILARQIPTERHVPRQIPFSVLHVKPEHQEFPFEVVITINPDKDIVDGYVAVEFEGERASCETDLTGGSLIFRPDEAVGNKPLQEYLMAHAIDSYVVALGSTPLTPKKPMHVVAWGRNSLTVTTVLFFEP